MKKLLLLIPVLALSCKTASKCDAYSMKINPTYDSLIVYRYNDMYIPKISIDGATTIYFHDIKSGRYRVRMFDSGNVETIKFKIK
jgi:hypothetical protein